MTSQGTAPTATPAVGAPSLTAPTASLFGLKITNVSEDEAVGLVERCVQEEQTRVLTLVNAAKIVHARDNARLRAAINDSDFVFVDGQPVLWTAHLLGVPLKARIAGCDFFERIVKEGMQRDFRCFFLGARPEVVRRAKETLTSRYPGTRIVGCRDGYFSLDQEVAVIDEINASGANILFLGFSSPMKEEFVLRHRDHFEHVRFIQGVGGSFDVVAGITQRAPRWLQTLGLEWFYRLLQEPGRMWKRYLSTNTRYILLTLREFVRVRLLRRNDT